MKRLLAQIQDKHSTFTDKQTRLREELAKRQGEEREVSSWNL